MTLQKDITVVTPRKRYRHNRLLPGAPHQLWLAPEASAGVEAAIVYADRGSLVSAGSHGEVAVFAKNGSRMRVSLARDSVVFHEPFAITSAIQDADRTLKFIPVPAIRPGFLDALMKYVERPAGIGEK